MAAATCDWFDWWRSAPAKPTGARCQAQARAAAAGREECQLQSTCAASDVRVSVLCRLCSSCATSKYMRTHPFRVFSADVAFSGTVQTISALTDWRPPVAVSKKPGERLRTQRAGKPTVAVSKCERGNRGGADRMPLRADPRCCTRRVWRAQKPEERSIPKRRGGLRTQVCAG